MEFEEPICFIKQTYDLENIRVLKYVRLKNMMAFLLAVFYFVAIILNKSQKLTIMARYVLKCAKRVFGIPDFKYYALGDGLSNIFSRFRKTIRTHNNEGSTINFWIWLKMGCIQILNLSVLLHKLYKLNLKSRNINITKISTPI